MCGRFSSTSQLQFLLEQFRADVANDRLPSVSYIVAPEAYTEHPNWGPHYGEWYVSRVIDILADNPRVWSKMALFVTYDEEGGFFDHLVPPTPGVLSALGGVLAEVTGPRMAIAAAGVLILASPLLLRRPSTALPVNRR